jgi:EAL domain-containing protein (putative c-di-GMP-specific phosphodiesterase class I)/ActR/RegA family two-component response regulator
MPHLLVLDDEAEIGQAVGDLADEFGFQVDLTTTPAEFVKIIARREPDLIVLDLTFPGGDGIEILRILEAGRYKGAVILISGTDARVLTTARRLGVALGLDVIGTVQKPFTPASIRELFAKLVARKPTFSAAEFGAALTNSGVILHYQPVVDIKSREILGIEALVRWVRPNKDVTMPDAFLPSVEREGLMPALTRAVMNMALSDASRWKQEGIDLRVAINVPAGVVLAPSFFDELTEARRRLDSNAPRVLVELTETEAMGEPVRMMEVLSRLRLSGVELAIDDFGTGYSSLVELRRLPFNRLKIDKSFVLACTREDDAAAITRGVIELAHALGISVVAEGVETKEIWNQLAEWHCDAAQGYFVGRPMPSDEFIDWIGGWN